MPFFSGIWSKALAAGAILAAIFISALTLFQKGKSAGAADVVIRDQKISDATAQKVTEARAKVESGTADQARADLTKNDIDPNA